jgi:hypothetical protein
MAHSRNARDINRVLFGNLRLAMLTALSFYFLHNVSTMNQT